MDTDDTSRLQDTSEWDYESAERCWMPRGRRAVVAVHFTIADFTVVSDAAESRGQTVTQFIRDSALSRALGSDEEGASS